MYACEENKPAHTHTRAPADNYKYRRNAQNNTTRAHNIKQLQTYKLIVMVVYVIQIYIEIVVKSVYVFCRLHCDLSASYAYFRMNTVVNQKNYTISTS